MRNIDISRITIDMPKNLHKKFKALAAANGKSMKEMVIEYINDQVEGCPHSHIPNKETVKSLENIKNGKNLVESKDLKDFFKKLGL